MGGAATAWREMGCCLHLDGAFGQATEVRDPILVAVHALGSSKSGTFERTGARIKARPGIVLGGWFGCGLELGESGCGVRIFPQHHDAVIVIPTSLVDGGPGLVTDSQEHTISTIRVVEGRCGAAGGHNAGVDVELLGGIKRLHFRRRG